MLKAPAFRTTVALSDGRAGYRELWECTSDPRLAKASADTRAWACIQVSYSPGSGQWVAELSRLYTRTTGTVREVKTKSMRPIRWCVVADEDNLDAARACARRARERLPEFLRPAPPIQPDPIAVAIFIPEDVLL